MGGNSEGEKSPADRGRNLLSSGGAYQIWEGVLVAECRNRKIRWAVALQSRSIRDRVMKVHSVRVRRTYHQEGGVTCRIVALAPGDDSSYAINAPGVCSTPPRERRKLVGMEREQRMNQILNANEVLYTV